MICYTWASRLGLEIGATGIRTDLKLVQNRGPGIGVGSDSDKWDSGPAQKPQKAVTETCKVT